MNVTYNSMRNGVCLMPLSTIFQLYHGYPGFQYCSLLIYPEINCIKLLPSTKVCGMTRSGIEHRVLTTLVTTQMRRFHDNKEDTV